MSSPQGSTRRRYVSPVRTAMRRCYGAFVGVGLFSGVINVLALTGSFYMLQVYDRVLPSRSLPTLVGLTILMAGLFVAYGLLDHFRVRVMSRVGIRIDRALRDRVFQAIQLLPLRTRAAGDGLQPVRDLDNIRSFLSGLGPTALFDLPWIPVYLGVVFLLHPLLGLFATAGALILVCLTLLTEVMSSGPMREAAHSGAQRFAFGEAARRNAEVIRAMGMGGRLGQTWSDLNGRHLSDQIKASDAAGGIGTLTKILRMLLQSGILGLGAYLVLRNELSAGAIVAASIIMSRALAPVEVAIGNWRGFVAARQSRRRLEDLFAGLDAQDEPRVALPAPTRQLTVQSLTVAPPGQSKPVIQGISFALEAGQGLGVIGPSGSGKSSLARALVGAWMPMRGGSSVRLDGAALDQWAPDDLGRHVGYLPQDVELFDGTVAENIARFDPEATSERIIAAARHAGVHDLIVHLPEGYDTRIGESGSRLSAGQRQRIALARALYGDPFLVVLDEPNSNLDAVGDMALNQAIRSVRQRNGIVIVIAHRPSALAGVDLLLALVNGQLQEFGPKQEVLRKVTQPAPGQPQPPGGASMPGMAANAPAQRPAQPAFPLQPMGLKIVSD